MGYECEADGFVRVCSVYDLADPGMTTVRIGERTVALFHVSGQFLATDDRCTHDGGNLIAGQLKGYTIVCPRHGAKFDIRTGKVLLPPASVDLAVLEVRIEGDDVLVRVSEDI